MLKNYAIWIPSVLSIIALLWNYWQQKRIEELKHENERTNLIHRVQFEKEFNIYNDLWGKLIDLRNITGDLRPEMGYYDTSKTAEEIAREKLVRINEAFQACVISFDKNKPFYPKEVYDEIEKVLRLSKREATQFQYGDSRKEEYWEEAKKNIQEIIKSMDNACDIIRTRIGLIRIKE
jgi:hypothetical protein